MKTSDAVRHLTERARVQRHEKTSYNRLRWNSADLEAVEAVVAALVRCARERQEARAPLVLRPGEIDELNQRDARPIF